MTTTGTSFLGRSSSILAHLEETGQLKQLQMIESPMGPRISIRGRGEVDCFCSNNYLGLANHPDVVDGWTTTDMIERLWPDGWNPNIEPLISDAGLLIAAACQSSNHRRTISTGSNFSQMSSPFSTINRRLP